MGLKWERESTHHWIASKGEWRARVYRHRNHRQDGGPSSYNAYWDWRLESPTMRIESRDVIGEPRAETRKAAQGIVEAELAIHLLPDPLTAKDLHRAFDDRLQQDGFGR